MHISVNYNSCVFMKALRASGIYVDEGGIEGFSSQMVTGDEEAMKYFFDLWQNGYRGESRDDPLLASYIKRGKGRYDKQKEGPTGVQGQ